jgi:exonuclease SbcC
MGKINRAILSEPHIGLDLKIVKRKIEQRAVKAAGLAEQVSKLDPQLVHSEGQMAALAVSMLCAANLTFQWSRWPALILDDPLQHNDVIHASAFADMLCNLVSAKGYQIFLSTHDLAQAEFLRRKFSASNVPCTMIHLRGRGGSSLDTDIKLYDRVDSLASEQLATQHS